MATMGKRIHRVRLDRGFSLPGLADMAGTSKQALSQIEKGVTKNPSAELVEKISQALDVSTTWVITGKGPVCRASQSVALDHAILAKTFNLIAGLLREDDRSFDLNRHAEAFDIVYRGGGEVPPAQVEFLRQRLRDAYRGERDGSGEFGKAGGGASQETGRAAKL